MKHLLLYSYRSIIADFIFLTLVMGLFLSSISPRVATAREGGFSQSVAGTYLLLEEPGFKRLMTVTEDGNFLTVAQEATVIGFSDGQGTWQRSDDDKISARVIDFDFNLNDGSVKGVSLLDYVVTFTNKVDGKFQSVDGEFRGETFAPDQDPLNPTEDPISTFGATFTGQRVSPNNGNDDD